MAKKTQEVQTQEKRKTISPFKDKKELDKEIKSFINKFKTYPFGAVHILRD